MTSGLSVFSAPEGALGTCHVLLHSKEGCRQQLVLSGSLDFAITVDLRDGGKNGANRLHHRSSVRLGDKGHTGEAS